MQRSPSSGSTGGPTLARRLYDLAQNPPCLRRAVALRSGHDRRGGPMRPPRTLSVSAALHSRIWLLKIRRKARTLEDVVEQALDVLEEQEANDG